MDRIAAFIPVYRHPKQLAKLVENLAAEQYPGARIVVVVDGESSPEIDAALAPFRSLPCLQVIEGQPHLGKALALDAAVASGDWEQLVFMDNDIILEAGQAIFSGCAHLLDTNDILELPKLGHGAGFVPEMMKYEFMANIIGSEYLAKRISRCPSMNGAAFAVRRELFERLGGFRPIVNEDTDFAARAFLAGAKYGIDPVLRVGNELPHGVGEWYRQRRRWAVSIGLWSQHYIPEFRKAFPRLAGKLGLSAASFALPCLAALLGVAASISAAVGGTGWVGFAAGWLPFLVCGFWFSRTLRRYHQGFSWPSFLAYSLIYSPVWAIASTTGALVVRFRLVPDLDWTCAAPEKDGRQPPENVGRQPPPVQ